MTSGPGFLPPAQHFQRQLMLTPKRVGYVGSYSREMLAVEEMRDHVFDQMLVRFTTSIWSGKTITDKQRASVKVPASWWQHLKKTAADWHTAWLRKPHSPWLLFILPLDLLTIVPRVYLIPWFLRHHPVKYAELTAEVRFTRETLYPGADVSLPPSRFGAPVMWESMEIVPSVAAAQLWALEDYGAPRFADSHEIVSEIMRDPDLQTASPRFGSFGGMDPGTVFGVLEWLGRHGVSVDQLVARSAL